MIKITRKLIKDLSLEAKNSGRKRKNLNFHKTDSDTFQRMLNALEPGTYCQPHKHEDPDKREVFVILSGRLVAVEFDKDGTILDHVILDPINGERAAVLEERTWHTIIPLAEGTCIFELKDGPYDSLNDKMFAEWAPKEGDISANEYNRKILSELNIENKNY